MNKKKITEAEMRRPSEYGGKPAREVEVSGRSASERSRIVRSDPTDPRIGRG